MASRVVMFVHGQMLSSDFSSGDGSRTQAIAPPLSAPRPPPSAMQLLLTAKDISPTLVDCIQNQIPAPAGVRSIETDRWPPQHGRNGSTGPIGFVNISS